MLSKVKSKRAEIIFVLFLFSFYFMWALIIPFEGAPDEKMRYDIPQYIYNNFKLPYGWEEELRSPLWGISYGFSSVFSYILSGIIMLITGVFTSEPGALLMAARMVSVLSGVGTGWLALKIGEEIFDNQYKWIFAFLVTLLPEVAFISGYVNNDSFSLFTVALAYYMLLQGKKRLWDYKSCFKLGASLGLVLLGYYNAYIVIICAIIYCVVDVLRSEQIKKKLKFILPRVLIVLGGCILVCGWYFVRNYIIYNGDILGIETSRKCGELYAVDGLKPSQRGHFFEKGSISYFLFDMKWLFLSYISFIAGFGNMEIFLSEELYSIIYYIMLFMIIGGAVSILWKKNRTKQGLLAFVFFINILGSIGLSLYYSYFNDFQPQGRYCLPMVFGLMYFLTYGIRGWIKIINKPEIEGKIVSIMIVLIAGLSIWAFTNGAYIGYQKYY